MLFQFLPQHHPVNHNEPNTTSKVYLQNQIKSDKMGRNVVLTSNFSSFSPYFPDIKHHFPISTDATKTMLKPILISPSLSSLPKKTNNFKWKTDVNNHRNTKRSTFSLPVSRNTATTKDYPNSTPQNQIESQKMSKLCLPDRKLCPSRKKSFG